ncbi:hypothetical protein CP8484711_2230A, partial [Chlamydia psittaci 84-8471/1]
MQLLQERILYGLRSL